MQSIQFLLSQVSEINKRYSELAKLSGDNFNVFQILRLNTDELSHSKIIAELLDPKGAHEVGDKFLELFLETIGIKEFLTQDATIVLEKFVGRINEANTKGGRIDIVIQEATGSKEILIENKIYAGDQENQLLRYYNYNDSAQLIYLTLFGSKIEGNYINDSMYYQISYSSQILEWLEKCKKEVVDKPIVRETITQYTHLLKTLTGQSKFKEMEKELNTIMDLNKETVEAAFIIAENIDNFRLHLFENLFKPQMRELAKDFNLEPHFSEDSPKTQYYWFSFQNKNFPTIELTFSFDLGNFKNMVYGFALSNDPNSGIPEELQTIIGSNPQYGRNSKWPIYSYMDVHKDWTKESFIAIRNGEMKKHIEAKIEELLEIWPEYRVKELHQTPQ